MTFGARWFGRATTICVALALAVGCAAPASGPGDTARPPDHALIGEPYFDALGGRPGIEAIVERFAQTDVRRFRRLLVEFFCSVSGGPCEYTGDSMFDTHRTMGIEPGEMDALVRDLMGAFDDVGTPRAARNRLLGRLAPFYGDIVDT